ncbi:hypothetical protein QTP86_034282 [Hemibagrus guttatus]|nr:hypothetical protein QTP86_034282 [Hemibagrus guttatus]
MSYRGQTLVINNLAASSLWHKLACMDPPRNLLANIQALLVDFFWDGLYWIPQNILHLPKEEGGQGLAQLFSRAAAFCPQFTQRLLTGPRELESHLLRDCDAPGACEHHGARPVEGKGLGSTYGTAVPACCQSYTCWRSALTSEECVQLMDYQHTETGPAEDKPFPQLNITPDLDRCAGPLLEWEMDFGSVSGKLLYRACVKVLNKKKLSGRVDTPWRSVLGFNGDIKPEWTH